MKLAQREFSMDDIRKLYRVATDLVGRLDRQYKAVQAVADLFTVEVIVCRQQLHDACSQLLDADEADRYSKKCLDIMWKKIYYEVIQVARQIKKGSRWELEEKAMLWSHLTAGVGHYECLLVDAVGEIDLPFDQYIPWVSQPPNYLSRLGLRVEGNQNSNQRLVDRICHCLIVLGDLNRYLNHLNDSKAVGHPPYSSLALQHYQTASKVNPKNGMPFNQMGMLLGMKGAVLDATFYYLRSMQAQNPFEGAEGNFKLLVSKTLSEESGQEPLTLSAAKASPLMPMLTHLLVCVKCCIFHEEVEEDALTKAAKNAAKGFEDIAGVHEVDEKTGIQLVVILAACVKTFKDKQSNLWGIKGWFCFRIGEILLNRFLAELKHSLESPNSLKYLEDRIHENAPPEGRLATDESSGIARRGQLKVGRDESDAESDASDGSPDFVIEGTDDEEEEVPRSRAIGGSRSGTPTDKTSEDRLSDSEFHTPEALSPAPGPKSPTGAASVDLDAVRKDLMTAVEKSQLLRASKLLHDLLRWNLDLVRTCGAHLPSVWTEIANLANVLSVCLSDTKSLPDEANFILKSRFFPDECSLFEEDEYYEGYKAMKPPPPDQFIDVHDDSGASGDQESYTAFKQRVKDVKSKLGHRDKVLLRMWLMRRLAEQLCRVDATGMRYDEENDSFYLEETSTANVSPLVARGDSRDPTVKLCAELTKAYKMSVLAQQYIKGQVADFGRQEKNPVSGNSSQDAQKLPTPPYIIPDTATLTDHLKSVKELLRTGDYVLIIPRPVWLGLDKLKSKSRRARDAIRWLESLTLKDDSHFRFQRAQEQEKIDFVKRPKMKSRDSWLLLEILECCHSVAQRGVAARRSLIGRQYEDEHQAWEMSTVLFLVGGFDVNDAEGGNVGTFLTAQEKASAGEMTALEVARAAGVRMENVQDYYTTWKKTQTKGN